MIKKYPKRKGIVGRSVTATEKVGEIFSQTTKKILQEKH